MFALNLSRFDSVLRAHGPESTGPPCWVAVFGQ